MVRGGGGGGGRRFLCTYSTVARFLSEIVPTDSSSPPLLLQF